jgi:hypothetical protein
MKYGRAMHILAIISIAAASVSLTGCAKKAPWGSIEEGLILEYKMPEGSTFGYEISQIAEQEFEMMGQPTTMEFDKSYVITLLSRGLKQGNHDLGITIESMDAGMSSPQGDFPADVSGVAGKSFDLTLSPLGKEMQLAGADAIEYGLGMAGSRSVTPDFQSMFPDLPGRPVKAGDTWTSADSLNVKDSGSDILIATSSVHTLDGIETINGMECARIKTDVTGTVTREGSQMGATLAFSGTGEGAEVWYFAYEEGLFAKLNTDLSLTSTITVSGTQEMTIPMSQRMTTETVLVR